MKRVWKKLILKNRKREWGTIIPLNGLEREWEWKENFDWKYYQNLGTGREGNKSISKIRRREGKKNSIYNICEQESKV